MSAKETAKLNKEHVEDYMDIVFDGSNLDKLFQDPLNSKENRVLKRAEEFKLPEIGEEEPVGETVEKPEGKEVNVGATIETGSEVSDSSLKKLEDVSDVLTKVVLEVKLMELRNDILREVEEAIIPLQKELNDFKERKIPKRRYFDTAGAYQEELYSIGTKVLDSVLINLFNEVPDYNLISSQVTKLYDDGSVANGIITLGVVVAKDGYRYDFKADLPILNGIIHTPQYVQRGLKIIPLTQEAIYEEMESVAFRKIDVDTMPLKNNIFNNLGNNITKRPDNQKFVEIDTPAAQLQGPPMKSQWNTHKEKGY